MCITDQLHLCYSITALGYFRDDNKMAVLTFCAFNFQAAFILQNLLVIPMPSEAIKNYTWQVGINIYQSSNYFTLSSFKFSAYICSYPFMSMDFMFVYLGNQESKIFKKSNCTEQL